MTRLMSELKTLPGAMLSIIILLMITWFVVNLIRQKAPAPLSTGAGFILDHATGQAYANMPTPTASYGGVN